MLGLVLASVVLLVSLATAQEFDAISPNSLESFGYELVDEAYPPLSPEYDEYLKECANKITPDYAEEIEIGILKNEPLTTNCCKALVHLGYDCHIQLVKFLLLNPELKDKASKPLPRSVQIWKTCALVVDVDQSVAPSLV
ncbi:hypothetical protein M0R45_036476 [Rubus argutus]|uniref:Prolamin-like domain-containing protein n=1 Tax=Rubus argutus TaxID=59490 RepID=A0AAW1W0K0_RUBAR